jgi:hypothetical protein
MLHALQGRRKCPGFWWKNPEGKKPFERSRLRWNDGIRMILGRLAGRGCRMNPVGSG